MTRTEKVACNLCEAICGLEITLEDDRITRIAGDPDDPLSRGHICPKAVALQDIQSDPDRLRQPCRRGAQGFEPVAWEAAIEEACQRLHAVIDAHGPNAVGIYMGNPNVHNWGSMTHAQHFLRQIRTRNRFSATSVDQLPHHLVSYWMYGHQLAIPIPDIDHTDYFLMLGANPMASNGSIMTVPDFRGRLKALQGRGGRMTVVDPRRTETAKLADRHLFIRPGRDVYFLAALLGLVWRAAEQLPARLAEFVADAEGLTAWLDEIPVSDFVAASGVAAAELEAVAQEFMAAQSAVCYGRMGVSTQRHGTLCQWLIQLINLISGNLDAVGGALLTQPAVDRVHGPGSRPGHFDQFRSRLRGLPEFGGELPVAALAEEIETTGPDQIRALICIAGNPVLSTPDGGRLARALDGLDFMLSVDIYPTETTRKAHIVLPPTPYLQHDHYDLIFHHFAVRNTARYSPAILPVEPGLKHDWQIFNELALCFAAQGGESINPLPEPAKILDMGLRAGPYGKDGLSLKKLRDEPSGIDLGPLQPSFPQRIYHEDKQIQALPEALVTAFAALRDGLATAAEGAGLLLIGRRHLRSNNSWLHNSQRLVKGPRRDQLLMHPDDMARQGLQDGARVEVRSAIGATETEVSADTDMMRGVVSLPHGFGHAASGQQRARELTGANCNLLIAGDALDPVSANAALNGVPVEVRAVAA